MYIPAMILCAQDKPKDSTKVPDWQVPNTLKPQLNNTSFFHAGYEFTGKSIPFAGYTYFQSYTTSTGFPQYSTRFIDFAILMDVGGGLFINGTDTRFASHFDFHYIWDCHERSCWFHPCIGFHSTQIWDRSFSQAFLPEIGFSMHGVMDIKYGYQLIQTGIMEPLPQHSVIFTLRPGIFLSWFDKNP